MSDVAVIGAGYVGLTTAVCLAHLGHRVTCADIDAERVDRLSKGEVPILEDGLPEILAEGLSSRRLSFVLGAKNAARVAEFVFLCVPTPQGDDGSADLSFVEDVAREIAPVLAPGTVVINKSTMPVGSTRMVERILASAGTSIEEVRVASNPEFLREGSSVRDFLHPNRVVIGCDDPAVAVRVSALYRSLNAPILVTDPASAEMIKYASNAFLATKISFVNAIANLCEAVDADVREVALGMGYDHRIGFEFLHPGPGYGGSCFPKDTAALLYTARNAGFDFSLLEGVVEVNQRQHERMVHKLEALVGGSLDGVPIAVWGLTFKANTDDLRDSPALVITKRLIEQGAKVRAFDPAAGERAAELVPGIEIVADAYEACAGARAGCAHGVGRVPLARLRSRGRSARDSADPRHSQPARPGLAASTRVHLRRSGALVTEHPRRRAGDHPRRRAVVTGAAGFLGSHLVHGLLERGWDVVGLDNLLTGRMENIADLLTDPGFTFEHYDVTNFIHVTGPVDAVLHFASPASPQDYLEHPIKTMKVGALGTHNTLGLALAKNARYLLASTSEIYGDPLIHPQPETYWGNVNPIGPRGVYDEAKRFGEALTLAYHRAHGLDVRIVRIFNTYGPRLRPADGRVVSNFLVQAMDDKPLTVYGDGLQTRSFCYVEDEVRGILSLLESDYVGPVNIGNPNEFTILELAQEVLAVTGSRSEIHHEDLPMDDPTQRRPDITLARELLGWEPQVELHEGLVRTLEWYRAEREAHHG